MSSVLDCLETVNFKFTEKSEVSCQILCLKILSKFLNHDSLECYYLYLKQISRKIAFLCEQDKEVYYIEVKRLIKIIKTKIAKGTDDEEMLADDEATTGYLEQQNDQSFQFAGATQI